MRRRAFVVGSAVLFVACKKSDQLRCKSCGMKIDMASAWRTDLVTGTGVTSFDTPRCAFLAWRNGSVVATGLRAQDYYDRTWHDGTDLRFVLGGDVVGLMGPDLVPVDAARVGKFIQDHGADRALRQDEVTSEILAKLK